MQLRFSEEELLTLVEMVSLAAEVSGMSETEEAFEGQERFEKMEHKVLEAAKNTGMGEIVEFDVDREKNRVTEKFQEGAFFQRCLEEFRNTIFWEDLMLRLTERDLVKEMGRLSYDAMDEVERRKKSEPRERRYWEKFLKDGVEGLFWIDRNEDGLLG